MSLVKPLIQSIMVDGGKFWRNLVNTVIHVFMPGKYRWNGCDKK